MPPAAPAMVKWKRSSTAWLGSRPKSMFTGMRKKRTILRRTRLARLLQVVGRVGVAEAQRSRQRVPRAVVVVLVQAQAPAVVVEGALGLSQQGRANRLAGGRLLQLGGDAVAVAFVDVLAETDVALGEEDLGELIDGMG